MPESGLHQAEVPTRRSRRRSLPSGSRGDFPIVAIGASAGGLDAFRKLVAALPAGSGMACILVQHLDPTHESMMVDLLAGHTSMTVRQATDGMLVEPSNSISIRPDPICRSATAPCTSRSRRPVMVRACRSTSCCTRWRRNTASVRSA